MARAGARYVQGDADSAVTAASPPGAGTPPRRPRGAPALAVSVGVTIAVTLVATLTIVQLALGRFPFGDAGSLHDLRIATVHCLLVSYLPAAYLYLGAVERRTLLALRPALDIDAREFGRMLAGIGRMEVGRHILFALIGLAVAYIGPFLSGPGPAQPWVASGFLGATVERLFFAE